MNVKAMGKAELREALVAREADDHKGIFGHVLVVAGSRGMAGAAILATRAALRSGAGLVTVAVPGGVAGVVAGVVPSAMTLALPENAAGVFRPEGVDLLKKYAKERCVMTMAIGPGMTTHADAARLTLLALSGVPVAAVVDADALNNLAQQEREGVVRMFMARKQSCVFTPHPAEVARLLGMKKSEVSAQRQKCVEKLARSLGGVALLAGTRPRFIGRAHGRQRHWRAGPGKGGLGRPDRFDAGSGRRYRSADRGDLLSGGPRRLAARICRRRRGGEGPDDLGRDLDGPRDTCRTRSKPCAIKVVFEEERRARRAPRPMLKPGRRAFARRARRRQDDARPRPRPRRGV